MPHILHRDAPAAQLSGTPDENAHTLPPRIPSYPAHLTCMKPMFHSVHDEMAAV
jgi:hypothetical protein